MKTIIGNYEFSSGTHIVGILNVTPDSFSDGGKFTSKDAVLKRAEEMIRQGAAVIDIGGESTRPGHTPISDEEETERVIPFLQLIKSHFDIPVSVDTYKYSVALSALSEGADMINDIWGFKKSPKIAKIVKEYDACCCLMHNRNNTDYSSFAVDLKNDLHESIDIAVSNGICSEKIIIDAGIGFAKNTGQNLEALKQTENLRTELGYPIMVAVSRKSIIGNVLNVELPHRLSGTLAATAYAFFSGARFVRVHDIAENKQVIDMLEAISKGEIYE
ncbi:MAG: dihydropteroate synthase [Oscillospiraceae bacterium]|nr:dihydropteroate synthase [Oscillospiraceae bacterium]